MKTVFTFLFVCLLGLHAALGSGYHVVLQGNRITAMGNMGVALRPDASSLFFNPGATGFMGGNAVMAGFNPIFSNNVFWNSEVPNSTYTANSDNPMGTPFHFFAAWGPESLPLTFGLSATTPFGSGVDWGEEWMGRDLLTSISLRAIQVQPTVSWKINDKFGIGAGLIIGFGSVELNRRLLIDGQDGEGSANLQGDAELAFGYNVGLYYLPSEKVSLGLSYRSRVDMTLEGGSAEFTVPGSLSGFFPAGNTFNASLPLPAVLTAGIAWDPMEKLTVGVEYSFVAWSAYDSLIFDFAQNTPVLEDSRNPRNYQNSSIYRIGAEYRPAEKWQIRAGFYYDETPVEKGYMTAETPDANRIGLTAGIGYTMGKLQLDASVLYVHGAERRQTVQDATQAGTFDAINGNRSVMPGTYRLNAFIPGVSISYKF
jgi:long-chain fatty acid transport protein